MSTFPLMIRTQKTLCVTILLSSLFCTPVAADLGKLTKPLRQWCKQLLAKPNYSFDQPITLEVDAFRALELAHEIEKDSPDTQVVIDDIVKLTQPSSTTVRAVKRMIDIVSASAGLLATVPLYPFIERKQIY